MRLELPSCCVRDLIAADAASLARYANNRQIWLNLRDRFPHPYTLRDAVSFIEHVRSQSPPTVWAIDVAGEAVGTIGIMPRDDVERISAEIGYWLGEPFWGRGIMTEVLMAVTQWSLKEFQLTRIYALPFANNSASCRVLEKAGYVCEGRLHKSAIKGGQVIDQFMYAYIQDTIAVSLRT
ncbi:MAG TPA: GNAT family N-acetyltransferase [Pirellulaceae bacterium]|nr:GNAT family N-acetyltransferase [Pirellulaceae bacterium]